MGRWCLLVMLATAPLRASADGAFPGQTVVLLPPSAPHRILVGTNFGLLLSEDDGAHWYYVCEGAAAPGGGNVSLYFLGQGDTVFALAPSGFGRSDDAGRTWIAGGGSIAGLTLTDGFADPNDDSHVFVIATGSDGTFGLYPSTNGGLTFGPAVLTTTDERILSVELSTSPAGILYVTTYKGTPPNDDGAGVASLLRSTDLGATFTRNVLTNVPNNYISIAEVDPTDASSIYFRLTDTTTGNDSFGISTDGATVQSELVLNTTMGGFARLSDGTLVVGGPPIGTTGTLWIRAPGATTWTMQAGAPVPCLNASGTTLYVCGPGYGSAFGLATSTDLGMTYNPLMFLSDVIGPIPCNPVEGTCAMSWSALQSSFSFVGESQPPAGGPYITCDARKGCGCGAAPASAAFLLVLFALRRLNRRTCSR